MELGKECNIKKNRKLIPEAEAVRSTRTFFHMTLGWICTFKLIKIYFKKTYLVQIVEKEVLQKTGQKDV